jgi:hypothetical protein
VNRVRLAVDGDEAAPVERCLAYLPDPRPDPRRRRELFKLVDIPGWYGLGPARGAGAPRRRHLTQAPATGR